MEKRFLKFSIYSLVFTFLVVLAGSVVRSTGSGMGCPDWPKCFGYLIPPTDVQTLIWEEGRDFEEGQMIIHNEALWKANKDFVAGSSLEMSNWDKYTKHDYALFNPRHTWTEYINRLTGAIAGIVVFIMTFLSFRIWRKRKLLWPFVVSLATLFLFGFEAWLGKVVVEGNLIPHHISMHMLGAVVIVLLLVYLIYHVRSYTQKRVSKVFQGLLLLSLVLSLIQVVMGSQVREQVDIVSHAAELERAEWIEALPLIFEVHRSFSILLVLLAIYLFVLNRSESYGLRGIYAYAGMIFLLVISGISLSYAGMPAFAQPLHLMLGMGLTGVQLFLYLQVRTSSKGIAKIKD